MKQKNYPWAMLASIYITQYIGLAFIMSAAVAILRQKGVALDQLALLNLAFLPLAGKVLYAPIIDKFRFILQGQYRSWLIFAQTAMALMLLAASTLNVEHDFGLLLGVFGVYTFFMSLQDVSVDGLSCKLFDRDSRKFANSIQFSGNLLGNIIGGGLILMAYSWLHWQGALWLLAALTCVSLIQMMMFREPSAYDSMNAALMTEKTPIIKEVLAFVRQHRSWFMAMALYPIASACGFALINPMLVDGGWQLDDIGFVLKIFGSIVGLFSALLASPLLTYLGREKALMSVVVAQFFALLMMIPIALGHTDKVMVYSAITLHFMSFPATLVVTSTIIMDKAALTQRKATFFALQFSFASLLGFAYSSLSMALAGHFGYSSVIVAGALVSFAIVLVMGLIFGLKVAISAEGNATLKQEVA